MLKHQRVYSAAVGTLAAITVNEPTKIYKDRKDSTESRHPVKRKKECNGEQQSSKKIVVVNLKQEEKT